MKEAPSPGIVGGDYRKQPSKVWPEEVKNTPQGGTAKVDMNVTSASPGLPVTDIVNLSAAPIQFEKPPMPSGIP